MLVSTCEFKTQDELFILIIIILVIVSKSLKKLKLVHFGTIFRKSLELKAFKALTNLQTKIKQFILEQLFRKLSLNRFGTNSEAL